MVSTDLDLVTKLMSLPWEARAELIDLLAGPEDISPKTAFERLEGHLDDSRRLASHGRG